MLNFKIKKLDNFKFSYKAICDYYETVQQDFQHLRWDADKNNLTGMLNGKKHVVNGWQSYAIQSNYKDPSRPCMSYHVQDKTDPDYDGNFQVKTDLVFGFAEKIIETIPNVRQTVISVHPPKTYIDFHVDNIEFVKVHIPIVSTEASYFKFEDEDFILKPGFAYLVNTTLPHATDNQGEHIRAHLIFKIPTQDVNKFIDTEWHII